MLYSPIHGSKARKSRLAGTGKGKAGYVKIRFCGERAALDGLLYFWWILVAHNIIDLEVDDAER